MSDQIDRYAPALSATSDMPEMAPDPAPAEPTAEQPSPAEPQPAPEPAHTPEEPALSESVEPAPEPVEEAAPPEPRGVGKALAAKDAAIAAANARADEAQRQAQATLKAMEALAARIQAPPEVPAEPVDTRPSREQFNSPDEYDTALVEWAGRASARAAEAHLEKQSGERQKAEEVKVQQAKMQEQRNKVVLDWNEKKAKALEELYDYAEVAERADVPITEVMSWAIAGAVGTPVGDIEGAPNGPQIAYHLGKNPDEAARIAKLPPAQQLIEIGVISARLAAPKPNVSRAPDPIRPVRASNAAALKKSPDEESMAEYGARRQAEINAERRARAGSLH